MKSVLKYVLLYFGILVTIILSIFTTILLTQSKTLNKIGLVVKSEGVFSTELEPLKLENFENKYCDFLNDEKAQYISERCKEFKVDTDLVVAILQKENPSLKEDAVSKMNKNGSVDLGLFQLNDQSLYKWDFLKNWWKEDIMGEFNASNWKHNSYIAIKYIQDLTKTFGENNVYYIAAAYNAGCTKAWNTYIGNIDGAQIPQSTIEDYVPSVLSNYKIWKNK